MAGLASDPDSVTMYQAETFCVPSEAIVYRDKLANPSGNSTGVK